LVAGYDGGTAGSIYTGDARATDADGHEENRAAL